MNKHWLTFELGEGLIRAYDLKGKRLEVLPPVVKERESLGLCSFLVMVVWGHGQRGGRSWRGGVGIRFWTDGVEYGCPKEDLVWKAYPIGCFQFQVTGWLRTHEHVWAYVAEECRDKWASGMVDQEASWCHPKLRCSLTLSSAFHMGGFIRKLILLMVTGGSL